MSYGIEFHTIYEYIKLQEASKLCLPILYSVC